VKKGATKPDISSVEAFKRALLNAKSVAYADPAAGATSGAYLAQAVEKLGISAELKPKTRLISAGTAQGPRVGEAVARGEAEIGIQPSRAYGISRPSAHRSTLSAGHGL
jgi:molybdate transport system substrate-binding protein